MRKFRKPGALLLCLLFVLSLMGCSMILPEEEAPPQTLSVYLPWPGIQNSDLRFLLDRYSLAYPDIEVTLYDPRGGDESLSEEQVMTKMNADILAGAGPDVIMNYSVFVSLKMMKSGAYRDMSDFYDKDEAIHSGLYEEDIMDAGVIDGRRCFIPLSYSASTLVSTKERLKEAGFDEAAFGSSRAFTDELLEFLSSGQRMCYSTSSTDTGFLRDVIPSMIDTSSLTVSDNQEELKYYFDLIRLAREKEKKSPYPYFNMDASAYPTGDALWGWTSGDYLFSWHSTLHLALQTSSMLLPEETPVVLPFLNSENKVTCTPQVITVVNNNCKNPEAAYHFIQATLAKPFQGSHFLGPDAPVLKEAEQAYSDRFKEGIKRGSEMFSVNPDGTEGEGYTLTEWTPEFEEAAKKALDCPKTVVFGIEPYLEQFNKYMEPYYDGTAGYEECFDRARAQVETMLSE